MIEQRGYPAFSYFPITGPAVSKPRPIDPTSGSVRVTLQGLAFTVRVQISNAQPGIGDQPHLFLPPETSWETHKTVQAGDPPVLIPMPLRWVRLVLDSGTVLGGNIEESTKSIVEVSDELLTNLNQTTDEIRSITGIRSIGRAPQPGDPAGLYRLATAAGTVDITWDGTKETGRTPATATAQQVAAIAAGFDTGTPADKAVLQGTEGYDPNNYTLGFSRTLTANDAAGRTWAVNGQVIIPDSTTNTEDHAGINGRGILQKTGGSLWGGVFLASSHPTSIPGVVDTTAGSPVVKASVGQGTKFLTDLKNATHIFLTSDGTHGELYQIASLDSDTQITLTTPVTTTYTNKGIMKSAGPRDANGKATVLRGVEIDINVGWGVDATLPVDQETSGVSIVSGGTYRPTDAVEIFKGPDSAPFLNGILFKDSGVYDSLIYANNVAPKNILTVSDSYAGGAVLNVKSGIPALQMRQGNGSMTLVVTEGNDTKVRLGTGASVVVVNSTNTKELLRLGDDGRLVLAPGVEVYFTNAMNTAQEALRLNANDRFEQGNLGIIPIQAAALTSPVPSNAAGASPTQAEFNALVTRLAELESKLRAAGSLK